MDTPQQRKRELALIHIAKTQLGLDDCTYRQLLWQLAKVRSSRDLDANGRQQLLAHFEQKGWRRSPPKKAARGAPKNRPSAQHAGLLGKIGALLTAMELPWHYAHGISQQMFKIERAEWCQPDQLRKIIAALNYKARKKTHA
ncbi:gp16 family protein [Nitrosomonas halophila]|uniref:Mu-like prophage protein gp16 n=1 Tax=Nitrosomonas halophila TaxID=44576 RepID=A0A1H3FEN6_9PROT|nr:regulatory protein GemA [Nitrosomonas halophila]SDX89227.1 Mu-like prophage protein gp16 [Nitrosomonas halophila]